MPPVIDHRKCTACFRCVEVCHQDVFYGSVPINVPVVAYPNECWPCGACALVCDDGAIQFEIPLPLRLSVRGRIVRT